MEGYILAELIYPPKFLHLLKKLGDEFFSQGIYYYKLLEYTIVVHELRGKDKKILDIGSGKSFLPFFYLDRGWETWVVDNGDFYPDFERFYLRLVEDKFSKGLSKFEVLNDDFLKADLPLNYFDFITGISTLEHFPGTKDMRTAQKISSLLKKGGKCIITLPFSQSGTKERTVVKDGFSFFQRDYELKCVFNRIVKPSGLHLRYFYVLGERNPRWGSKFFLCKPLSRFKNVWSLFPFIFWKVYYKGKSEHLPLFRYPGIIVVVLEKKDESFCNSSCL